MKSAKNISNYFDGFPGKTKQQLRKMRQAIKQAVPKAKEKISYGIPTFTLSGNLVHFAGWKTHIGFYPGSRAIARFKKELSKYQVSKGTVQFPVDKRLPLALINRIVKFTVKERLRKVKKSS